MADSRVSAAAAVAAAAAVVAAAAAANDLSSSYLDGVHAAKKQLKGERTDGRGRKNNNLSTAQGKILTSEPLKSELFIGELLDHGIAN